MNKYVIERTRRQARRFALLSLYFTGLVGVVLLIIAAGLRSGSMPNLVLLGIGSSVIATAIFVFFTASREGPAAALIEQGIERIFDNRQAAFDDDDWAILINTARQWYRVVGVANHGYIRASSAETTRVGVTEALKRGVSVEILWLNPTSDVARLREDEEGNRGTREDAIKSIRWFFELRETLGNKEKQRLSLRHYDALPTSGLTWVDDIIIVTHYLASEQNRTCPGIVMREDNRFLQAVATLRLQRTERQLAAKYRDAYIGLLSNSKSIDKPYIDRLNAATLPPGKISEEQLRQG